jgi:hypothetical protein
MPLDLVRTGSDSGWVPIPLAPINVGNTDTSLVVLQLSLLQSMTYLTLIHHRN